MNIKRFDLIIHRILMLMMIVFFATLSSCYIYGPETENKRASDYFNKKSYEGGSVLCVPVLKAKKRNTIIEGIAIKDDYTPFKFENVFLFDANGTKVSETTTTAKGVFKFMDYIENGDYLIKTESSRWSGEIHIKVDGYHLDKITLDVKPNKE
ncbi:uncharacterized protein Dvar_53140 [Desulfosarcina variabilis str. Montpellier]